MPDCDNDGCRVVGRRHTGSRLDEGAQQTERLEVDRGQLDAGLNCGALVRLDLVAGSDDEQHPPCRLAVLADALLEHAVVEHRL